MGHIRRQTLSSRGAACLDAMRRWLLMLLCLAATGAAAAGQISVVEAAIAPDGRGQALTAQFDINLGPRLEEAVNYGVPLDFRFEFTLSRRRWYWIDEHITGRVLRYQLGYNALTRQYRLSFGGLHQKFATLAEALRALGRIARLHVVDAGELEPGADYRAAVRLSLDHTQLPKPLQIDSLTEQHWRVEAETRRWDFIAGPPPP